MSAISSILTPEQFEQYSAEWLKIASATEGPAPAQCFAAPGHGRRTHASLPIQQLVWLASTLGIVAVRTQFLAIAHQGHPARFALALFATDAAGTRLSAYYLAEAEEAPAAAENALAAPPLRTAHQKAAQVPHDLVKTWLHNWAAAPAVTPALFATG
ncbi:hypothetical protein [Hymenobacter coccineus]|uniref:Uncharacterized protein n=1 Tax=Hymenobacter coccineus TaxID=1908235 RepID=A0A1G1THL4_9BACT|nr:hypothetical protein [Hymenobacter coccineus]OGX90364.1 hypothetical protein BEN49_23010 [Hymenobacter coccineus]